MKPNPMAKALSHGLFRHKKLVDRKKRIRAGYRKHKGREH